MRTVTKRAYLVGYIVTGAAAVAPAYILVALSIRQVQGPSVLDGLIAALLVGSYLGAVVWVRERRNP